MNWLAAYIMRGRTQAMLVATTLAIVSLVMPPISVVSSASVALVTLRLGAFEGFWVLACSSIVAGLLGLLLLDNYQFALLYALVLWLPVWLIGIVLREGRHLSLAIEIAVSLGILGVLIGYLYSSDLALIWQQLLKQMLPDDVPPDAQEKIEILAHYMTGIAAAGTISSLLFGLFLGRWWQANLYNPGGFRQEFLSLTAHLPLTIASIVSIVLAAVTNGIFSEVLWNIVIVLFVLYALIGTAILHIIFSTMQLARFAIPMFYITLFLIPHALLPVALIGLSDKWLNLRKKYSTSNTPKA